MPMTNSANFEVHVTIDKVNMEYVKKSWTYKRYILCIMTLAMIYILHCSKSDICI